MQNNLKVAVKMVAMMLFACLISFFVYISLFTIVKTFTTSVVGYDVYELAEDNTYNKIGYITKDQQPTEPNESLRYVSVYSNIPKSAQVVLGVLQVLSGVGIVFCMVGSVVAASAAKDRNDADFNGVTADKNRGLFLGLFSAIPLAVLYVITLIIKMLPSSNFSEVYYWFYRWIIMCPVKPLVDLMTGNAATAEVAPYWSILLQGIFILLFVLCSFVLYRICFNEDSVIAKLLYKSTKKQEKPRRLGGR